MVFVRAYSLQNFTREFQSCSNNVATGLKINANLIITITFYCVIAGKTISITDGTCRPPRCQYAMGRI